MGKTRRTLLGAATGAIAVSGCLGDDGDSTSGDTPTETDSTPMGNGGTPTGTMDGSSATVQVSDHPDHGEVLVGPDGMTLYMFDQDTRGDLASSCYDGCAGNWPPLTDGEPTAGDGVSAELETFERETGETQVAAGGWPLYYFAQDEEPGDATGQGVQDVWWVLRPDGTPVKPGTSTETPMAADVQVSDHPDHGEILVGPDGNTLYMFDQDTQGEGASACYDGCAGNWPPLTVDGDPTAGADVTADLSTFERDTGETQVAAGGWPLYFFAQDEEPGDATGQGVQDVWWVLRPDGTPVRPGSTVQVRDHPDHGEVLVGPDGMTLYMFDQDTQGEGASACYDGCAGNWPPLTDSEPTAGDGVSAELTTFERDTGETQVAAGGWPLYYFAQDEEPGDATGQGVQDVWWVLDGAGKPVKPGSSEDGGGGTTDGGGGGGYY